MPKLKKSELKKHLLGSVKILKRTLDYSAYCYFILAVFFFYHITEMPNSFEGLQKETRISLARAAYSSITAGQQRKKKDLREEWLEAFSMLENLAAPMRGVLLPSIPPATIPDADLLEYRDALDKLQQKTGVFSTVGSFSHAYEYWISQLARMTTRRGVAFYTQRPLVRLLVEMIKPSAGMTIYDPTAGTGGMLIGCAQYIRQQGGTLDSTHFYGREKSPNVWAICKMNMLAHQMPNTTIEQGDTLQSSPDLLGTFDLVLQSMPLSSESGNRTQTRRTNAAFLEHIIEALSPSGKAAILAPSTILHQEYQDIWRYLLNRDWLEAVISLPPSVLHGTSAPASVLVINKKKSVERSSQVLFVLFPATFSRRSWHNELQFEDVQPVIHAFERWGVGADHARILPISQIEEQNYSLRIEQYPDWVETPQSFDLTTALNRYRLATQKREAAVERLMKSLDDLQLPGKNV